MVELQLVDGVLEVDCKNDPYMLDWDRRSFFAIAAGYEIDASVKKYYLSDRTRIHRVLLDTIEYLEEDSIPYTKVDPIVKTPRVPFLKCICPFCEDRY